MRTAKMGPERRVLLACLAMVLLAVSSHAMKFNEEFNVVWQTQDSEESVDMALTKAGGANFESSKAYLHGSFSVRIKLIPGESAGTVAAFYVSVHHRGNFGLVAVISCKILDCSVCWIVFPIMCWPIDRGYPLLRSLRGWDYCVSLANIDFARSCAAHVI
jgi:hypothetical protein